MERARALPRSERRGLHERNEARHTHRHRASRCRGSGLLDPGQVRRIAMAGATICEHPLRGVDRRGAAGVVGTVWPGPVRAPQGPAELRAVCSTRAVLCGIRLRGVGLRPLRFPTPPR
ncbi:hypothetical protein NDU88_005915 [Pleurodeles waltl]|uniref:Uncharacterized protein n=1 Tax=Pleurodeles waltl TaxID=8319 RepID=A0AAV7NWM6_PLEWA|nr:hypothetical protein NDU88_005915 [Pleurodeles waltl]